MTLRLADAILLGDVLKKRNPYFFYPRPDEAGITCGCAIAGAFLAVGDGSHFGKMAKLWPWVTEAIEDQIGIWFFRVCRGAETIEALCDWVDSIDPTPRIEPPVQEPSPVDVRQESTVSHD